MQAGSSFPSFIVQSSILNVATPRTTKLEISSLEGSPPPSTSSAATSGSISAFETTLVGTLRSSRLICLSSLASKLLSLDW